jgi:NAD+ dependent glucose-6-phosphate dehydrogenase
VKKGAALKIVVTGAAGNMGRKLANHLRESSELDLRLLDISDDANLGVIACDLSRYEESWAEHFSNADVVVHFAADRSASSGWDTILPLNVDLLINVYEAVRQKKVKRIIFASSNWVVAGHRFGDERITPFTAPKPINPYGAAKLFGERLGKSLSDNCGVSVINLRIGYNQWLRNNRPSAAMELGAWGQMLWLSDRDFLQAMDKAIGAKNVNFATLNVTSHVIGSRWDLSETARVIGYQPQDSYEISMPLHRRLTQLGAWVRDVGGDRLRRGFSDNW